MVSVISRWSDQHRRPRFQSEFRTSAGMVCARPSPRAAGSRVAQMSQEAARWSAAWVRLPCRTSDAANPSRILQRPHDTVDWNIRDVASRRDTGGAVSERVSPDRHGPADDPRVPHSERRLHQAPVSDSPRHRPVRTGLFIAAGRSRCGNASGRHGSWVFTPDLIIVDSARAGSMSCSNRLRGQRGGGR